LSKKRKRTAGKTRKGKQSKGPGCGRARSALSGIGSESAGVGRRPVSFETKELAKKEETPRKKPFEKPSLPKKKKTNQPRTKAKRNPRGRKNPKPALLKRKNFGKGKKSHSLQKKKKIPSKWEKLTPALSGPGKKQKKESRKKKKSEAGHQRIIRKEDAYVNGANL